MNKQNSLKLITAYQNDDIEKFRQFIKMGDNINCCNQSGDSLFEIVLSVDSKKRNKRKFIEELIDYGAHETSNVNFNFLFERSLFFEINDDHINKLLENNININSFGVVKQFDLDGSKYARKCSPPIFCAIESLNKKYVDMVLKHNPDLEICDAMNNPILNRLFQIFFSGRVPTHDIIPILSSLIENGADPNQRDSFGNQSIHVLSDKHYMMKSFKDFETYEKLFDILCSQNIDINSRNFRGSTPMGYATKSDNCLAIKKLIKYGASSKKDDCMFPPLFMSIIMRKKELTSIFIELNHELSYCCPYGYNIIHHMAVSENTDYRSEEESYDLSYYEKILDLYPELLHKENEKKQTPIDLIKMIKKEEKKESLLNLIKKYK